MTKWTDEQLVSAVQSALCMSDVLRTLELKMVPGNRRTLKRAIDRLELSTTHFRSHEASVRKLLEMISEKRAQALSRTSKVCIQCHAEKPTSQFNKNKAKLDGAQARCRDCDRDRSKKYFREYIKDDNARQSLKERRKRIVLNLKDLVIEHLKKNPCVDCGEADLVVLDFDHREGTDKKANIADLLRSARKERLLEEIQKCDVRCANCHRRRTAKQFNWYKLSA